MSEDQGEVKNSEEREGLHDADRALKSIQRGQEEGKWSTPEPAYTGEPVPPQTEKKYPTQEEREEALAKMPGEETVPLEIKEELTEETKRIHTTAMEGGEKKQAESPKVKPFIEDAQAPPPPSRAPKPISPQAGGKAEKRISMKEILDAQKKIDEIKEGPAPEILKARGGAEPLKRILKAQEKMDREKAALKESAPERAKARIQKKDEKPTPQKATQVLKPKREPFFSRVLRKILGKR